LTTGRPRCELKRPLQFCINRRSLTGELSLSCARPAADGRPLMSVNRPLQVSQLGQLSLSSLPGRKKRVAMNESCSSAQLQLRQYTIISDRTSPLRVVHCRHSRFGTALMSATVCPSHTELAVGPLCVTRSNPTRQLTDPTQPVTNGKIWTQPNATDKFNCLVQPDLA